MNQRADLRRDLFAAALDLPTAERASFLARTCADQRLRTEVLELLAITPPEHFLTPPTLTAGLPADPLMRPVFGPYRVLAGPEELGTDRRLARDDATDRTVVIELQPQPAAVEDHRIAAFVRTAHAMNQLRHSSYVAVHEHGWHAASFWFARDHVQGHDLDTELGRQQRLDAAPGQTGLPLLPPIGSREWLQGLLAIFEAVVGLLQAAHRVGIAHGDLSATHILLDRDGRAHVTGFGMAAMRGEPGSAVADMAAVSALLHRALLETLAHRGSGNRAAMTATDDANCTQLAHRTDPRRRRPYSELAALLADLRQVVSGQPLASSSWLELVGRWFAGRKHSFDAAE
ncbi:MAG: protein kinase [Planctomycetota bacterium]